MAANDRAMEAAHIRRRYGELIQKIKSFRMAIDDYRDVLVVHVRCDTESRPKTGRRRSAVRRKYHADALSASHEQSQVCTDYGHHSEEKDLCAQNARQPLQQQTLDARRVDRMHYADADGLPALVPGQTTEKRPKSSRYLHSKLSIESPYFIKRLYSDLLFELRLLRTSVATKHCEHEQFQPAERLQLRGLVSDLERQLHRCDLKLLKLLGDKTEPEAPVDHKRPLKSAKRRATPVEEEPQLATVNVGLATVVVPQIPTEKVVVPPGKPCSGRAVSRVTSRRYTQRRQRPPRIGYPYGSCFPELTPLPLVRTRTFVKLSSYEPRASSTTTFFKYNRERSWLY